MRGLCPYCNKTTDINFIEVIERVNVRSEDIDVHAEYYKCSECGGEFENQYSDHDPLAEAYKKYRDNHNMVQPDTIREFRKNYGLTQSELSNILGWGGATLSRYENGALQDDTHDRILQLVMNPLNLLNLIKNNPGSLSGTKRKQLMQRLKGIINETSIYTVIFDMSSEFFEPDITNGFRRFNLQRIMNAILFFCKDGIFKTKLNKLLFYSDFKNFKDNGISITGSRYIHLPLGPVPDEYDCIFTMMHAVEKSIGVEEVDFPDGSSGEKLYSLKKPDSSVLKPHELETLEYVRDYFKNFTAKQIMDFSHREAGYMETHRNEIISYSFADKLQI